MSALKFYEVSQGTVAHRRLRAGRPTASNFHRIVTPKGEPSKQALPYLYRLVAERLLNDVLDEDHLSYVKAVQDGIKREPQAIAMFNFMNEIRIEPGGFCTTDDGRVGASPDGMLKGMKEAIEVKCPAPQTQIRYLLHGPEDDYRAQVQGQLMVGGFQAVHFFSYHPQMPPYHKVTLPDRLYIDTLRSALSSFCDTLDVLTEQAQRIGAYVRTKLDVESGEQVFRLVDPSKEEARNGSEV